MRPVQANREYSMLRRGVVKRLLPSTIQRRASFGVRSGVDPALSNSLRFFCLAPASLRGRDLRSSLKCSSAESWGELCPVYAVGD